MIINLLFSVLDVPHTEVTDTKENNEPIEASSQIRKYCIVPFVHVSTIDFQKPDRQCGLNK